MKELTQDNLGSLLSSNDKAFVMYGASWCGNCRLLKPKVKRMATENPSITYVYVDAEKYPESRQFADVKNLPTFAIFKEGEIEGEVMTSKLEEVKILNDALTNL